MPNSTEHKRSFQLRIKIALVSLLSFIVTTACTLSRTRPTPEPTCYTAIAPTDPPTPEVLCYEMVEPTNTPTPTVTCYTATPTTFTSPLSPLPTPTPTSTPTPEARRLLLDELLAEGRFPQDVARQLNESLGI